MSNDSPAVVIFSSDGYELTVKDNVIIPTDTNAIIIGGSDGAKSRFIKVDSSGNLIVTGNGIAGTPSEDVFSIQGITGGIPLPIETAAAEHSVSQALENYKILKIGTGVIYSLGVEIEALLNVTIVYIELYDTDTLPSDGNNSALELLGSYKVNHMYNTSDQISLSSSNGLSFGNGCTVILTTSRYPNTTKITGGPFVWFNGEIK